jgi:hypothetical protein
MTTTDEGNVIGICGACGDEIHEDETWRDYDALTIVGLHHEACAEDVKAGLYY